MAARTTESTEGLVPGVAVEVAWLRQPGLPFAVSSVRGPRQITIIVLQGQVDTQTAPRVRDALAAAVEEGARAVVFDLSAVTFIDGTGLGVIVLAARRLGLGAVALVLPHRGLVRIFRLCRLDRMLDIYETQEQAVRGLPTQGPSGRAGDRHSNPQEKGW